YKLQFYRPQGDVNLQRPEFQDIYNDIQVRLLKRFRALKEDPTQNHIANLRGYVTTVTRNTCDDYLRRRYPLRRSLKDKVRRHLLSRPEFALWEDADRNWLAGLSGWENWDCGPAGIELRERLQAKSLTLDVQRLQLHDLMTTIFHVVQAP